MNNLEKAFQYDCLYIPGVIASSRRYTHSEKIGLMAILNQFMVEDRITKKTSRISNRYLAYLCGLSLKTISRLKKKVQKEGLFTIIARHNADDLWKLNEIPPIYYDEYRELTSDQSNDYPGENDE